MLRACVLGLALIAAVAAEPSANCIGCMCVVSSFGCQMPEPVCSDNPSSGEVCGPWAITEPYWKDGGALGDTFHLCAADWKCNEETVRAYLKRYGGSSSSCEEYARIHIGGPNGANADWTLEYWGDVEECLDSGGYTLPPQ